MSESGNTRAVLCLLLPRMKFPSNSSLLFTQCLNRGCNYRIFLSRRFHRPILSLNLPLIQTPTNLVPRVSLLHLPWSFLPTTKGGRRQGRETLGTSLDPRRNLSDQSQARTELAYFRLKIYRSVKMP